MTDAIFRPPPTLAGDWTDDDADVLVRQLAGPADGIDRSGIPTTGDDVVATPPRPCTRMLTTSIDLDAAWDGVLLMPADPLRESLILWAGSDTATDYVRVADDRDKLTTLSACASLFSGQEIVLPTVHSGPVWVSCTDATGPVRVVAVAVTR